MFIFTPMTSRYTYKQWVEILGNIVFWILCVWLLFLTTETGIVETEIMDDNGVITEERIVESLFKTRNFWGLLVLPLIFYWNTFYLIPRFYARKEYGSYISLLLLGILSALLVQISVVFLQEKVLMAPMINFFLFRTLLIMAVSILYGMVRLQLKNEAQAQDLQNEKIQAELKLMQSQINPHFMFNALNNLLAISERSGTSQTSMGISQLSEMLRFMLYDTQEKDISISKEVEFIENYMALQRLKYSDEDPFDIQFNKDIDQFEHSIAPNLFIPFIENAYKHGLHIESPSFIFIELLAKENELHFHVKNSKHLLQKTEFDKKYSGIGLENVTKRLKLLYPHRHHLEIEEDDATFSVQLKISL